ncbi:glycosyltransferase family A protein [Sulfolobus tengchongensis]|uniref:Glycosyltransferase family A protein n=1 Tax=Sulfolobus tengchongensis TaxID=207809 RepID=A0AAX4L166_9CREN
MEVTVGIPTYKNNGETIGRLLDALTKQSFKRFKILIVYKESEGDKTLDVISQFQNKLDIEIKFQKEGYFEEAMNILYSEADSDILITTDDDAIPSSIWIEDHVKLHQNFSEYGVIGPLEGNIKDTDYNLFKLAYSKIMESPLEQKMLSFNNYFAITGILVKNPFISNKYNIVKTFNPIGFNMSIKREVYEDFKLPCFTIRGIGNEPYLCLHAYRKNLPCALVNNCCKTDHIDRDSLSRPKSISGIRERFAEYMLSVYYLSKIYRLSLSKLKIDIFLKGLMWNLRANSPEEKAKIDGIRKGLNIALIAIKHNKDANWIRSRLKNL